MIHFLCAGSGTEGIVLLLFLCAKGKRKDEAWCDQHGWV